MKSGIIIVLSIALTVFVFMWTHERGKNSSEENRLREQVEELTKMIDDATGAARQRRIEETDSFIRDYGSVISQIKEREIDIYKRTIEADKAILAEIEKIRSSRKSKTNPFAKWTKQTASADEYKYMEGRFINMLQSEISCCEDRIREVSSKREEENEYSRIIEIYPRCIFSNANGD